MRPPLEFGFSVKQRIRKRLAPPMNGRRRAVHHDDQKPGLMQRQSNRRRHIIHPLTIAVRVLPSITVSLPVYRTLHPTRGRPPRSNRYVT